MNKHCFYKGELVSPELLNGEFGRIERAENDLTAEMLGFGLIRGFGVSRASSSELLISPGLARSGLGERLVLKENYLLNILHLLPTQGSLRIRVGVTPEWAGSSPVVNTLGETVLTEWAQSLSVQAGEEPGSGVFILAEAELNPQGIVSVVQADNTFSLPLIEDICNPVGTITPMLRKTAPSRRWLLLDGGHYPKAGYPVLSALLADINPAWSISGDTFALPDLTDRARFLRMAGPSSPLGSFRNCGVQNHAHDTMLGSHGHTIYVEAGSNGSPNLRSGYSGWGKASVDQTDLGTRRSGNPVAGGAEETRPYDFAVNYFIKAR